MADEQKKLTVKEKAWADAFLITLNKTEAARRAKYKGDNSTLGHIGWENYRKAHIQAYLDAKLNEMAMSANEVLARLSEQASADMGDFLRFEEGIKLPFLDLKSADKRGLLRLVKKFKYNADGQPEIELYDAQAALVHIGKAHGLFSNEPGSSEDKPIFHKMVVLPPKDE